jgi:hypothetical protein
MSQALWEQIARRVGGLQEQVERLAVGEGPARGRTILGPGTTLTMAAGAVTVTGSFHVIDTSGGAAENLNTINGGVDGAILVLKSFSVARVPTLKDGAGNLALAGDFAMDATGDTIMLLYLSGTWRELSRSNNG